MARYSYKVRDGRGELATGVVQALTLEDASRMLRGEGKFVVSLGVASDADVAGRAAAEGADIPRGRVKRADVIAFAHQMAVMVDTGVPLSEALRCIGEQSTSPAFRATLADVTAQVESGGELSRAMAAHPKVFPQVMVSLIRASEMSGTMGPMLERISRYLTKEHQTAKKIRGAVMYPCFMLLMVLSTTAFLIAFVLPRFAGIYEGRGAALPLPTRLLMNLSSAVTGHPYVVLGTLAAIAVAVVFGRRTTSGKRLIDWLKLSTPVVGPLFTKLYITRGCRTMGTMIAAGVPILDMVAIVRQVTQNLYYQELWDRVDEKLRQGSQLSDALFTAPKLIPRSVSQMILSGEKSGRLGQTMERIAEFTEEEFDDQVKTSTQFIEPALIAAMGLIVGFVAVALLLPIFSMGKVMSS